MFSLKEEIKIKMDFIKRANPINLIFLPLFAIYFFSMVIHPLIVGNMSWQFTLGVWHKWQALNVGILAFSTSIIAFSITRYKEKERRKREFIVAKAFLLHTLNDLSEYLENYSTLLRRYIETNGDIQNQETINIPEGCLDSLANCIRHSPEKTSDFIAGIVSDLQLSQARISTIISTDERPTPGNRDYYNEIFLNTAEIKSKVDRLFDLARGESELNIEKIKLSEINNSMSVLNIHRGQHDGLEGLIARRYR